MPADSNAAATTLATVQAPVRDKLDAVVLTMQRGIARDVPLLAAAAGHLLAMKGKMFRPTLVLLASEIAGDGSDRAITAAAVVEMVHLATLVHDDAIDNSVLRRGMPTINSLYNDHVSVIMGDFLYSTALTTLMELNDLRAMRELIDASTQMSIGELRQLSTGTPLEFSEADYERLIRSKTASLISAACRVGALCGAEEHVDTLGAYGDALGMAFQITDDLIDYTEATETTGKPSGSDLREHKVTLPLIAALRTMSPSARRAVAALLEAPEPAGDDIEDVATIVVENGGMEYARMRGEEFAARARTALGTLPESAARDALDAAILYVMERRA